MSEKITGRQYALVALADILATNRVNSGNVYTVSVPPGALVTSITQQVPVAFNGSAAVTLAIAEGANAILAATTIKAPGVIASTYVATFYASGATFTLTVADVGPTFSTVGRALVTVAYTVAGRSNEVQSA